MYILLQIVGNNSVYKVVAKFGLMHMIATNLCEWLYVLVEETKQDILRAQHLRVDRGLLDISNKLLLNNQ